VSKYFSPGPMPIGIVTIPTLFHVWSVTFYAHLREENIVPHNTRFAFQSVHIFMYC